MPYSEVLKKAIEDSKLSHIEISQRCKNIGESIVPSYISKLVNNKMPPPTEKISLVLAQALEMDSKKLILEGYLDKAPKEIIDFLNSARLSVMTVVFKVFGETFSAEAFEEVKKILEILPLSEFLIEISKMQEASKVSIDDDVCKMEFKDVADAALTNLKEAIGIPVNDDSMFPLISKGSQVTLELKDKYEDGNIICFIKKNEKDLIWIRRCFFKGDTIIAIPLNVGYEAMTLTYSEVIILGEVVKEIKDFRK